MSNRLQHETSPYLLQHAANPVDWHPWGSEALERAKAEDKPIFLSIGYAACHWCHVMAHESFEDHETANLLNRHFINIKVDREERPDIDVIYMDAVVSITGQGGWPLSVFLTPDGRPFHGGTYFPPVPRFNIPSFREVLQEIARIWVEERPKAEQIADQLTRNITIGPQIVRTSQELNGSLLDHAVETLFRRFDWKRGGWGSAPKFPQSMIIEFLFRHHQRKDDKLALEMATQTLKNMARGGMYDLIGGGFHRYSVDDQWLVPHFEKMLYDNALLSQTYLHAWQITQDPFFLEISEETFNFLLREMHHPSGGFFSSLDADADGKEGSYYLWAMGEVMEILTDHAHSNLVFEAFGLTAEGNFEGKNIPYRAINEQTLADNHGLTPESLHTLLADAKRQLLLKREQRVRPGLDDKILTSWNGLLLSALATAARLISSEKYLPTAHQLAEFLLEELVIEGKLMRSWREGRARYQAYLEDHAALGLGMLDLYQTDFNPNWYQIAVKQAEEILEHFSDPEGGFFDTRDDHERMISRPKGIQDSPTPSGNTLATALLMRLFSFSGESRFGDPVEKNLSAIQSHLERYPSAFAGWLCEADYALGPQIQLAIVGSPDMPAFQDLILGANQRFHPRLVTAAGSPADPRQPHLLMGRAALNNQSTAYLCQGFACKLPTTSAEELMRQLDEVVV